MTSLHRAEAAPRARPWALVGLGLFILALWLLLHPWRDFAQDGQIYALFAMARLYPASLGSDFFVRYGAQDHYTLFSPLYAAAIRLLGLDQASALLTALTQAAFFGACWRLARLLTTRDKALLGLGLLVVLPDCYGAEQAFAYTEPFLTPRQPAEVFVLAGIGFALTRRRAATSVCLLAAALLHPIIAGAGIVFWLLYQFAAPHPRVTAFVAITGTALCALLALLPHGPLPHFDRDWLFSLQSYMPFMFPSLWRPGDWSWSLPGLVTLAVGGWSSIQPALRRLCGAALVTAIAGLVLTLIGGDVMHVVLVTQMQMWRWLWLSGCLSVLLLPLILGDLWQHGMRGRALAALLVCLLVAQGIFAWWHLATTTPVVESHFAARIGQLRVLASNPLLSAGLLALLWLAALHAKDRDAVLLAALGATALAAVAPYGVFMWTREPHPPGATAAYAPWRNVIPRSAAVLWPDSPPQQAWFALHRASYWSLVQMAGSVFSRQEWQTGLRRQQAVLNLVPSLDGTDVDATLRNLPKLQPRAALTALCSIPDLQYFASWRDLGPTPYPVLMQIQPRLRGPAALRLYRCAHDTG